MGLSDKNEEPASSTGSSVPNRFDPKAKVDLEVRAPVRFRFRCRGRRYSAEVETSAAGTVVRVIADAGYIPYTADSPDLRRTLLKALAMPPTGIEVAADQRILLKAEMPVDSPVRPERVVATAAALAMALGSGGTLDRFSKLYESSPENQ